tara:strand:+ start:59 stop:469 length:411 start_codon:yes stop_codon:yes gene_type:complete
MRDTYPNWSKSTTSNLQDWQEQILEREANPFGDHFAINPSSAQERKATPIYSGVLKYFPKALAEVAKTSKQGNDQHHADKPLHWDKSKSSDELDALTRHLIDHGVDPIDTDGVLHLAKVCWRSLAALERYLDGQDV